MKTYTVIISAAAEADLLAILDYISERAGEKIARGFVDASRPTASAFQPHPSREQVATTFDPDCEQLVSGVRRRSCSKSITNPAVLSSTASITADAASSAFPLKTIRQTKPIDYGSTLRIENESRIGNARFAPFATLYTRYSLTTASRP